MKKIMRAVCLLMVFATALFCAACGEEGRGTLTIADIEELEVGKTAAIEPVFSKEEFAEKITYSFTGEAIAIEDGVVTALEGGKTVRVTAKTEHHETTFKVTTAEEKVYGTFTVEDVIGLPAGSSADLQIVFTPAGTEEKISYRYAGSDIVIGDGRVTAINPNKTVEVTAKTDHHETTFTVTTVSSVLATHNVTAWVGYPASELPASAFGAGESYTWSGENDAVATFDAQKRTVTAVAPGSFTLRAESSEHIELYNVTVKTVTKSGIKWDLTVNQVGVPLDTSFSDQATEQVTQKWNGKGGNSETTLFIGDSFFDQRYFWTDFDTVYAGKNAICAGLSSSTTYDWEQLAETHLKDLAPKNIVMHIGTNNFYDDGDAAAEAIDGLQRLFTVLHANSPDTKIYYFAITQRVDTRYSRQVSETNDAMQEWCAARSWIEFLDTENSFSANDLRDGIHPTLAAYSVFTQALQRAGIQISDK